MPRFLEKILQHAAAAHGFTGRRADRYVYGAMNNQGSMHGNVETAKGARMDAEHAAKVSRPMHPKMHQRAAMVAEAHHHLKASVPEYSQVTGRQRMLMTQHHVNLRLGKVK